MKYQTDEFKNSQIESYKENPSRFVQSKMMVFVTYLTEKAADLFTEQSAKYIGESLKTKGFFTAPGSTKYHDNYEGGLFEHSVRVTDNLLLLTEKLNLKWTRPSSPVVVGMFHDLCKLDQYTKNEDGSFVYNKATLLNGHGEKSVIVTEQCGINLTEEEMLCIRYHMGAYEGDKSWDCLGKAIETYPNVLFTHLADMLDSRDVNDAIRNLI